jgi:hypothetical protein
MSLPSVETAREWRAKAMVDREGNSVGRIVYIYLDRVTGQPTWALVVPYRLRRKPAFVPLARAVDEDDRVRVHVPKAVVRKAPSVGRRRELAREHEARLLEHYGELADLASSRSGARRASTGAEAGMRARRWPRQRVERATEATKGAMASRVLRGSLLGGLGLAGSLAASRLLARRRRPPKGLLARRRRPPKGLLAASRAAIPWQRRRTARRRPLVVVVNARPARRRVPAAPLPPLSQRRSSNMRRKLGLAIGLAAGYVLGTRAGRERYEQIAQQARQLWQRPEVQNLVAKGRQTTRTGVERATGPADGGGGESPTSGR